MWTICDYPTVGLISDLCTYGYRACVACGPSTDSRSAKIGNKLDGNKKVKGKKISFIGDRRWTCRHHLYQIDLSFNGKLERRQPSSLCTDGMQDSLREGGKGGVEDPMHVYGVNHMSCLDALPYWKVT